MPGPGCTWEQELYFNPNDGHFLFKIKDLYSCADHVMLSSSYHNAGCHNREEPIVACQYATKSIAWKDILHNHPPLARLVVEHFFFRWKCLRMVVEFGASLSCPSAAVRKVYNQWPFYTQRNPKYLAQAMNNFLKLRFQWSVAEKGSALANKGQEFLTRYPDATIEMFQKLLESNTKYWGPPHFGELCIQWKMWKKT